MSSIRRRYRYLIIHVWVLLWPTLVKECQACPHVTCWISGPCTSLTVSDYTHAAGLRNRRVAHGPCITSLRVQIVGSQDPLLQFNSWTPKGLCYSTGLAQWTNWASETHGITRSHSHVSIRWSFLGKAVRSISPITLEGRVIGSVIKVMTDDKSLSQPWPETSYCPRKHISIHRQTAGGKHRTYCATNETSVTITFSTIYSNQGLYGES